MPKLGKLVWILVFVLLPVVAAAQVPDAAGEIVPGPNDFGTSSSNYLIIPAAAFIPSNSATGYSKPFLFLNRTGGGDSEFTYPLELPSGAIIQSITAYVRDTSATDDVTLRYCEQFATSGTGTSQDLNCGGAVGFPPTATTGTPGPTAITATMNRVYQNQVSGNDITHVILLHLGPDSSTMAHSVRVQWKRQVSPAPATATFSDVPTSHPFYQYIEALVAAGVTGGCNTGTYCPNDPITRGQMAVFLSRALGLHWAP